MKLGLRIAALVLFVVAALGQLIMIIYLKRKRDGKVTEIEKPILIATALSGAFVLIASILVIVSALLP